MDQKEPKTIHKNDQIQTRPNNNLAVKTQKQLQISGPDRKGKDGKPLVQISRSNMSWKKRSLWEALYDNKFVI